MQEIALNYNAILEIDTTPLEASRAWERMCAGWGNLAQSLNEVIQQFTWLCSGGWGSSVVTGGQYTLTLSGQRVYGDPAQDYIFSPDVMLKFGKYRNTTLRVTIPEINMVTTWAVTLANITESGGDSNNFNAITLAIHGNGAPQIDAGKLQSLTVVSVPGEETGETNIFVNPLLESGHSYKYATGANVAIPAYDAILTTGWLVWDGESPIEAVSGNPIVVAEVDNTNAAKKAGSATVHAA